jgi:RNA-binding protein YlmH
MDKPHILMVHKNIVDKEGVFLKSLEQLENCIKYHERVVTPFLTPEMRVVLEDIAAFEGDVETVEHGGFGHYERCRIEWFPSYLQASDPPAFIQALRITYQQKFNKLGHRDVLGALMGLGISRQKIGDIHVSEDAIDFVADSTMASYITANLDKVGRAGIRIAMIEMKDLAENTPTLRRAEDTVKSLRLDSVIASAYHLSRQEAQQAVKSGVVKVNYRETLQTSCTIAEGDLISVRGKGRFLLETVAGETKKERIRVVLAHYDA